MLCSKHLSEHDQYIEKQTQLQNELKYVWSHYIELFNQDEIRKEIKYLQIKLKHHRILNEVVNNSLSHNSMDKNKNLRTVIDILK
jgi:hypothetical protein